MIMKNIIFTSLFILVYNLVQTQSLDHHGITFKHSDLGWSGEYSEVLNDNLVLEIQTGNTEGALCYLIINQGLTKGEYIVYLKFEDNSVFEFDFWTSMYNSNKTEVLLHNDVLDKFLTNDLVKN